MFLNTLYWVPLGRSDARSSASSWTVRPRYSVSTAASESSSLVRISSTTATFSGLAILLPLAETDRDVTADTRDVPSKSESASSGGRLLPRWSGGVGAHYLEETGGLWQMKL